MSTFGAYEIHRPFTVSSQTHLQALRPQSGNHQLKKPQLMLDASLS